MESKNQKFNFQLTGIELVESQITTPVEKPTSNPVFQFEIHIEYKIDTKSKQVAVGCSVTIYSEQKENTFGKLKMNCIYNLANFDSYLNNEKKALTLPEEIIEILNSITISTTRGMMFSAFRGTILHHAILPIISPKQFKLDSTKPKK